MTVRLDRTPPTLTLSSPNSDQSTNAAAIVVAGTASDANAVVVEVGGAQVSSPGGSFAHTVPLAEGENQIAVLARDIADNLASEAAGVVRFTVPEVAITSPAPSTLTPDPTIEVRGTVSAGVTTVEVAGIPAQLAEGRFVAAGVPLFEGNNTLTAVARDAAGRASTASLQVIRDSTPPRLAIHAPTEGSTLAQPTVTVSGMVNDLIVGSFEESEAAVIVNGVPAQVANRTFAAAVSLAPGANTLTAIATDRAGNVGAASVTVHRADQLGEPRIVPVSGDRQSAPVGTELPSPLVVEVRDASGLPLAGRQVVFRVVSSDGLLAAQGEPACSVLTTTDAQGRAQARWTLGRRAGAGEDRAEASSPGEPGSVTFTASAAAAAPAAIHVDAGNLQFGQVGAPLPRPLVAVVTDAGHNRLPDVPVTFTVSAGGGSFGGQISVTVPTDAYGRALALLTLGPEAGFDNNRAEASFPGSPGAPAVFAASGRAAGDPAATRASGVVLDNTGTPIAGVTLRIEETGLATRSDAQGQFSLGPVPVGRIRLVADGSTAERPGTWPSLEYELVTIAGEDNRIGMPIYLLPIDQARGLFVDETHGGTLTLPELPGLALTVAPGAATFPGGGRSGVISVTLVHSDKVPMIPNFGQQPRLIVTIQPAGVRFDPPAALTLPNVDGLRPGAVTELYSFDHDLGMFVSIGTATVSADGTVLRSDPGVGVVEGGWHCGGNPAATAGAQSVRVRITTPSPVFALRRKETMVCASGGPQPGTFTWSVEDPDIARLSLGPSANSVGIRGLKAGSTKVRVTYTCASGAAAEDEIDVDVPSADVVVIAWVDGSKFDLEALGREANENLKGNLDGSILCHATLGDWSFGFPTALETDGDRRYANAFLLQRSANAPPPEEIDPDAEQGRGDFRLFGRLQVLRRRTSVELLQSAGGGGRNSGSLPVPLPAPEVRGGDPSGQCLRRTHRKRRNLPAQRGAHRSRGTESRSHDQRLRPGACSLRLPPLQGLRFARGEDHSLDLLGHPFGQRGAARASPASDLPNLFHL